MKKILKLTNLNLTEEQLIDLKEIIGDKFEIDDIKNVDKESKIKLSNSLSNVNELVEELLDLPKSIFKYDYILFVTDSSSLIQAISLMFNIISSIIKSQNRNKNEIIRPHLLFLYKGKEDINIAEGKIKYKYKQWIVI